VGCILSPLRGSFQEQLDLARIIPAALIHSAPQLEGIRGPQYIATQFHSWRTANLMPFGPRSEHARSEFERVPQYSIFLPCSDTD